MNKLIFSLTFFLFFYNSVSAQKKNVYFIKDNGQYVTLRDSADYIRVVQEPDKGSKLYLTSEFYINGKKKSVGMSSNIDPPKYQDTYLSFYPNGKRKEIATYKDGHLIDSVYHYYPNGKLYTFFVYSYKAEPIGSSYIVKEVNDSLGNTLVENGNGQAIFYDDNFKEITEKGMLKNGYPDGTWTGKEEQMGITYTQTYAAGKMTAGESTDEKGTIVHYTKEYVQPEFKGGMDHLYSYLATHVNYPQNCIDQGIQGVVILSFTVEKDGLLSDIKLVNYVNPDLAAEAIRVLKESPVWTPGMERGRKVRVRYSIPVSFSLH